MIIVRESSIKFLIQCCDLPLSCLNQLTIFRFKTKRGYSEALSINLFNYNVI